MQLPQIGQQNQNPYALPQQGDSPKMKLFIFGGIIVLLLLIVVVLFSNRTAAGQTDSKAAVDHISMALEIIDEYEEELQYAPTQNDIALTQILLRGNQQSLSKLYNEAFKPRKKLGGEAKLTSSLEQRLETANRNNTLDTEIITELQAQLTSAQRSLKAAKAGYKKAANRATVANAQNDLQSVSELLDRPR